MSPLHRKGGLQEAPGGKAQGREEVKMYLAGPMTGILDNNFPAFIDAAEKLRAIGYEVVNPAECDEPVMDQPWEYWMRRDLKLISDCDGIALLPGWENSRGAKLEMHIGRELGMKIVEAHTLINIAHEGRKCVRCDWGMVNVPCRTCPDPATFHAARSGAAG